MENISENAKRLAKAIYLKKKMYYNMRMKTLKLYATNITKKGVEMHIEKVDFIQQSRSALLRLQKEILRGDLAFSSQATQTYTLLKEVSEVINKICRVREICTDRYFLTFH